MSQALTAPEVLTDRYCGAKKRQGEGNCTRPAGWGTDHVGIGRCKLHGGKTRNHNKAAEPAMARRQAAELGLQIETTAEDALIHALWEAEGNLAFYREQVQELHGVTYWERSQGYGKDAEPYDAKQAVDPLVELYHRAEQWRATVAERLLKANVDERRVRLAERDATMVLAGQIATLKAMGLADRLEEFRALFIASLSHPEPIEAVSR